MEPEILHFQSSPGDVASSRTTFFFFIDKVLSSLPDRTQEELSTDQYRSVCVFVIVESVHLRQL